MMQSEAGLVGATAPAAQLEAFCRAVLTAAGADVATADAATSAMMHGSKLGIDSHGVRLLDHYVRGLTGGRINARPQPRLISAHGAVASIDADHAHGALAAYTAMEQALRIARESGVGAVAIRNSSHFGPAGAYALKAAEAGHIGIAVCNSDSFVRLHEGASRFHGTNPLAAAVPVPGGPPWLFDMATSAITYNRIQLLKGLGHPLPDGVASTGEGTDTRDPGQAEMLAPLGGREYGFKGAGLAGLVEILSAVLTGMRLSFEILPMGGPDFTTPREMGAFVLAINTEAFVERHAFEDGMRRYLAALRKSPARLGGLVLPPGEREWAEAERRRKDGIPIDPATATSFRRLAAEYDLQPPFVGSD